jgi:hypothetical protein
MRRTIGIDVNGIVVGKGKGCFICLKLGFSRRLENGFDGLGYFMSCNDTFVVCIFVRFSIGKVDLILKV